MKPVQIKTACLQPEQVVLDGVRRLVAAFRSTPESCYPGQVSPQNEKRRLVAALQTVRLIYTHASIDIAFKKMFSVKTRHAPRCARIPAGYRKMPRSVPCSLSRRAEAES
jgi:hypothetical protein